MNVLPALQHHLNQTTPHKWAPWPSHLDDKAFDEPFDITRHTAITTPIPGLKWTITAHITITQHDNTLEIEYLTGPDNKITTIDLFDPNYLEKILTIIHTP